MSVLQKEELARCVQMIDQNRMHEINRCKDVIVAQKSELEQKTAQMEALIRERDYWAAENEKNAYYANSTKAFIKRKILLKLGKIKE